VSIPYFEWDAVASLRDAKAETEWLIEKIGISSAVSLDQAG
jgi:hypothetical protein